MKVELLSITKDAERLIEDAGRTAYMTVDRKKRGSEKQFVQMLVRNDHLSVLEHAYASFRVRGGSRAFTHQLIRHRLCAFTQQSQRYVNEKEFAYVEPDAIKKKKEAHRLFADFMEKAREAYAGLQELGIRNEDARYVLPNAVGSEIVVSANFREWRHIIQLRGTIRAQWEIRRMAIEVLKVLKKHAPAAFGDLEIDRQKDVVRKVEARQDT